MADISKRAFLRTIWLLKDYLADIVIGGGWAPLIYYHYLLGDKTKNPARTFDIDLFEINIAEYFADLHSEGILMVLNQRPGNMLPSLNEDQFKQYVHGLLSKLISKISA